MVDSRRPNPLAELFGEVADRLQYDGWQPAVDVFETSRAVVVRAELAGVRRDDLRVHVEGQRLRIRGVRVSSSEEAGEEVRRLHQMEVAFGPFERVVEIGIPIEGESVKANLEDGFLRVVLPKRVPVSRRVDVQREE